MPKWGKKGVPGSMDHTSLQHFLCAWTLDEITVLFWQLMLTYSLQQWAHLRNDHYLKFRMLMQAFSSSSSWDLDLIKLTPASGSDETETLSKVVLLDHGTILVVTSGWSSSCLQTKAKLHYETQDRHTPETAYHKDLIHTYLPVSVKTDNQCLG